MVSVLSSTKSPRVLIGRIGSNGPFSQLAEGLRNSGYRVTEWESSRLGVHSTDRDVQEQMKGIDLAFLVVRDTDTDDRGGAIRPLQRILVQAGLMQGKLQMDRVVLLVEDSVRGLSADTGLSAIRFSADDPDVMLRSVLGKITSLFPDEDENEDENEDETNVIAMPPPPSADAKPIVQAPAVDPVADAGTGDVAGDDGQSDALKVALRLVLLVVLAALFSVLLAFMFAGREDESAVLEEGITTDALRRGPTSITSPPVTGAEAQTPATADVVVEESASPLGGATVESPAAPETNRSGPSQLLPATCQLNLRKGSLLDDAINCDGTGMLTLEGLEGPWHNEVAAVAIGEGVVGQLEYELRADGTTEGPSVIELPTGTTVLNERDALFGIGTIILRFSANDQHVHLFRRTSAGDESATLTFSLQP